MSRALIGQLIPLAERGLLSDTLIRTGIRKLSKGRLAATHSKSAEEKAKDFADLREFLRQSPLAQDTDAANEQHYALPPEFFKLVLGPHRKYSSCYFESSVKDLGAAEKQALELSAEHADLSDGLRILELGCGWGSFSLFMAERYPNAEITAVSNSARQRESITADAKSRGLKNLQVITADINDFEPAGTFDRIVSIEMFEHVRNYESLFARLLRWLNPGGALFVHVFRHETFAYTFERSDRADWMTRYFFTGGVMPNHELLPSFAAGFEREAEWKWDGTHYQHTAEAWLTNIDAHRAEVRAIFESCYGKKMAECWRRRWRIFFLACAELFGFDQGREWGVSHYRFRKPSA